MDRVEMKRRGADILLTFNSGGGDGPVSQLLPLNESLDFVCLLLRSGSLADSITIESANGLELTVAGWPESAAWLGIKDLHDESPSLVASFEGDNAHEFGRCLHDLYLQGTFPHQLPPEGSVFSRQVAAIQRNETGA